MENSKNNNFIALLQQHAKVSNAEATEHGNNLVKLFDLLAEIDNKQHPELYKEPLPERVNKLT